MLKCLLTVNDPGEHSVPLYTSCAKVKIRKVILEHDKVLFCFLVLYCMLNKLLVLCFRKDLVGILVRFDYQNVG